MITQSAKLNLIPGAVLPRINVSQYDKGSRTLEFPIYNGEQRFTLTSSMSASIHGTKPDGNGFAYAGTVNTTDNIVELDVVQQMTAVSGEVVCEVIITKSGKRIGTVNFILNVQPAALSDDTVISDSDLSIVEEALEFAEDIPGYRTEFEGYVEDAEAWAKGTRNGSAVPSTDPTYHNNSKFYANRYTELTAAITTMTNDLGAKNVLPFDLKEMMAINTGGTWSGNTYVFRGITFVFNDDGTVDLSGANSSSAAYVRFAHNDNRAKLPDGEYVVSKGVATNTNVNVHAVVGGTYYKDTDNTGKTFTIDSTHQCTSMTIEVLANTTISETITLKPMICPKSIYDLDPTFEPYAKTNQQLTEETTALLDNTEVNGAVNMLQNTASTSVSNGITCTVGSDGTMTLTSDGTTRTGNTDFIVKAAFALVDGMTYKLSGCPSGGVADNSGYRLYLQSYASDVGEGAIFTADSATGLSKNAIIRVGKAYVFNGAVVFKPMITVPTYNGDYVPYAKSNKELTTDKLDISTLKTVVAASSNFADFQTRIAAL